MKGMQARNCRCCSSHLSASLVSVVGSSASSSHNRLNSRNFSHCERLMSKARKLGASLRKFRNTVSREVLPLLLVPTRMVVSLSNSRRVLARRRKLQTSTQARWIGEALETLCEELIRSSSSAASPSWLASLVRSAVKVTIIPLSWQVSITSVSRSTFRSSPRSPCH
ncbi:hypothetical protein D9M69_496390 [compost metagenome]